MIYLFNLDINKVIGSISLGGGGGGCGGGDGSIGSGRISGLVIGGNVDSGESIVSHGDVSKW